jgi:hypothetical protein
MTGQEPGHAHGAPRDVERHVRHGHGHAHDLHHHGHRHGHEHHGHGHGHAHPGGLWGVVRNFFAPHSHDAADSIDDALEGSAQGIRAVKISLVA